MPAKRGGHYTGSSNPLPRSNHEEVTATEDPPRRNPDATLHKSCRLLLKSTTMYCTYYQNPTQLEKVTDDIELTPYRITEADCLKAWRDQEFTYGSVKMNVAPGKVNPIFLGVDVDRNGFWKTSKGTSKVYKRRLELINVNVLEQIDVFGEPSSRQVDGETLTWSDTRLTSSTYGGLVGISNNPPTSKCERASLYQGEGNIKGYPDGNKYLVINVLSSGFQLTKDTIICGLQVSMTTDPSIFVANTTSIRVDKADSNFSSQFSSFVSSGYLGIQIKLTDLLRSTGEELLENQCVIEHMIRQNIMQVAWKHPSAAARNLIGELGWSLTVAGDALVLKKCLYPAMVTPQSKCYTEIPIQTNSSTQMIFMDPLTRVIYKTSHVNTCSDDANPVFKIRDMYNHLKPQLNKVNDIKLLPSRLRKDDLTSMQVGSGHYPSELFFNLESSADHHSRKEEISRQLLRIAIDDPLTEIQGDSLISSLTHHIISPHPVYTIALISLLISIGSLILAIVALVIISKSKLWKVFQKRSEIYKYQSALLGLAVQEVIHLVKSPKFSFHQFIMATKVYHQYSRHLVGALVLDKIDFYRTYPEKASPKPQMCSTGWKTTSLHMPEEDH
ncbi:hypothetical protein M0802_012577 [Mischocyttarus mexicanus]|nr:hypothetical protein M0802_012577 [Mischocyttarus mexicanus]